MTLALGWKHLGEHDWLQLYGKQECLHHQHKMQWNSCIYICIRQQWFTNSAAQHEMSLNFVNWCLHWVHALERNRTVLLFTIKSCLCLSGAWMFRV